MLAKQLIFIVTLGPTLAIAGFEQGLSAFDVWDMAKAAKEYGSVAETDGRAAYALAQMYKRGYFGEPGEREKKYTNYLELAAKLGDAEAMAILGDSLVGGISRRDRIANLNATNAQRGLVLLRESCDKKFPLACGSLARINHDGLHVGDLKMPADPEEAKRFGNLWMREALAQTGAAWYSALTGFFGPNGASGIIDDIALMSFRIVLNRRVGVSDEESRYELTSGRKYSSAEVGTAMAQADVLEKAKGIREDRLPDVHSMARRIATYWAEPEQSSDETLSQITHALAAGLVAELRGSALLEKEGWDLLFKKMVNGTTPLVRLYYEKRLNLLKDKKLDARSWLTEKLAKLNDAHALRFVDRFLESGAGKKLARFEAALRKTTPEISILVQQLTFDPAMNKLGPTPQQRLLKYAESKNIRLEIDQTNIAERDRADFMRRQLARLSEVRSFDAIMLSSVLARLAGPAYLEVETMFSPAEISIVEAITSRPGNTHWQTIVQRVKELEEVRLKDADLQSLEKEFADKIDALKVRVRESPSMN